MTGDEDTDDNPPPRPSIPRRRREGIVIAATLSNARPRSRLWLAAALAALVAALTLAGVYWARAEGRAFPAPLRPFAAPGAPFLASLARAGLAKLRKVGETHAAEGEAAAGPGDARR